MGNAYWDVFLSKNVSDLVIESLRNVRDLKVRPLRAGRLRVALKILWAFSLLYTILWVTVKAKDVIESQDGNSLGRSSCENMSLIQRVNTIESASILDEFPEVFQGLGCLPRKYHINVDPSVPPVVHPPRRVLHSKRVPLKKELDRMENVGIIEKVPLNEPAD